MNRRAFLRTTTVLAATAMAGFRLSSAHAADYGGKLCVFLQASGGWDPTSFCDPKANTPGEPVINHWAEKGRSSRRGTSLTLHSRTTRHSSRSTTGACW